MKDEVTYQDYKQALRTVKEYFMKVTGKNECIIFHMDYIQPIEKHIEEIEIQNLTKP